MNTKIILLTTAIWFLGFQTISAQSNAEKIKRDVICSDCYPVPFPVEIPRPEYPPSAKFVRASGKIFVKILIDEKGNVIKAEALSGHMLLRGAAVRAALKARFHPVTLGGHTVKYVEVLTYDFVDDSPIQPEIIKLKDDKFISGGIVNGKATSLPKPVYSQEAKDFCVGGEVRVEVSVSEEGNVISAQAISGDKLLRDSAVKAAKKAKFPPVSEIPVKVKGILVYNFVPERKCINVGIINDRALNIPKPQTANIIHPRHLQIKEDQFVAVQIVVDMSGKVTGARTVSGHPLLRAACENAARQVRFSPTTIDGQYVYARGLIVYKFKTDGTVDTVIERNDKDVSALLTNLIKPPGVSCNCRFGGKSTVSVLIEVDTQGNIIKATAISGHPVLRSASEKAALSSKILPDKNGIIVLDYHFREIGRYSAECENIEIREINRNKQSP